MQKDIAEFLEDLEYEFIAQPAWAAHCYNFEYMSEYYDVCVEYMDEHNIQHDDLTTLYESTVREYNRICDDPNESFMNPESTETLEELDNEFLECFYKYVQEIVDDVKEDEICQ